MESRCMAHAISALAQNVAGLAALIGGESKLDLQRSNAKRADLHLEVRSTEYGSQYYGVSRRKMKQ